MNSDEYAVELPHVDDVREMGRRDVMRLDQAVDDGRTYLVEWNDWAFKPVLWPQMTEEERLQRNGVGEECDSCGDEIGPEAIVVNDTRGDTTEHYHVGCYSQ